MKLTDNQITILNNCKFGTIHYAENGDVAGLADLTSDQATISLLLDIRDLLILQIEVGLGGELEYQRPESINI